MSPVLLITTLLILASVPYILGRRRAVFAAGDNLAQMHSRPPYHGFYVAFWSIAPALIIAITWMIFKNTIALEFVLSDLDGNIGSVNPSARTLLANDIINLAGGQYIGRTADQWLMNAAENYNHVRHVCDRIVTALILIALTCGFIRSYHKVTLDFRARNAVEQLTQIILLACSGIAILTTIGIVFSLFFETARFFTKVPIADFLFGLEWSPQTALRDDQVGSTGLFGVIPLFFGTLFISFIAMCVAAPIGLMSAIYMAEYAPAKIREIAKPILEILAGIPTVVYGFFAALTVAPFFRNAGEASGLAVSSESALIAGGVMGIMLIPFVSSLSDDIIRAVPQSLREGSYGLGATQSETICQVILPAALPGIVGSMLLATSRAIGETMIVVMAAGLSANMTINPLEAVTTVTVQIVTLLVGDQEFDSAKTLAAFALGLLLFFVTLILNVFALWVVNKYREQYD